MGPLNRAWLIPILALVVACVGLGGCGSGGAPTSAPPLAELDAKVSGPIAACNDLKDDQVAAIACATEVWWGAVKGADDVATRLPAIDQLAEKTGDLVALACHSTMHEVGRRYAADQHITLGTLQGFLPRTNNAGCSAGFAHGLLIDLGPQVVAAGPKKVSALCHRYGTRYRVYSCVHGLGHAYSRHFLDLDMALASCGALPSNDAPDCAQGAFHDYWFAVSGVDSTSKKIVTTKDPRVLCRNRRSDFVAGCWYRAFLEIPPRVPIKDPSDLPRVCAGLQGIQRNGCITAVNVIASPDPFEQLGGCAHLTAADAPACIRGIAVQQLTDAKPDEQRDLVDGCRMFAASIQEQCVSWLSKLLAVVTDDKFAKHGCSALTEVRFRAWCEAGVRRTHEPLYTFS